MAAITVLVDGVPGVMDEDLLEKKTGVVDNDNEYTTWVEYRLKGNDVVVHRSAHITMKKWPGEMTGIAQPLG